MLQVTFWGVRGSCPCANEEAQRYGGHTSCVEVRAGDEPALILDLGTGVRRLADDALASGRPIGPLHANVLLSHLHWDHILGLPFCAPINLQGAEVDVFGPVQDGGTLHEAFDRFMQPPFFPVHVAELRGDVRFHDVWDEDLAVGAVKVRVRPVPHKGPTIGFRIEWEGRSIAYVADHQAPGDLRSISPEVLEVCDGVDLLIHDAQYSEAEFAEKSDWGHSTVGYAVHVAREAGARGLALFHHDPAHSDADVDRLLDHARGLPEAQRIDWILAAAEGQTLEWDAV
ncbi:MAG: MBL fold metallo-hydrolase [Actinomycetota bacterium]|nr:MBL fold metallo-hydrolase [Actinomycetota bacterium]